MIVAIGACAPIHPRVGQSGPPGCLIRAGLLCDSAGRDGGRIAPAATAGAFRRSGRGRMHPAGGDPFSHCAGGGDGRIGQRPITH
jgi:hypothetical protein